MLQEMSNEVLLEKVSGMLALITTGMQELSARMDGLTSRMDGLTTRMDGLTTRMDDLTTRMDDLTTRMDDLTTGMRELSAKVDHRFDQLEARVSGVEVRLKAVESEVVTLSLRMTVQEDALTALLRQVIVFADKEETRYRETKERFNWLDERIDKIESAQAETNRTLTSLEETVKLHHVWLTELRKVG